MFFQFLWIFLIFLRNFMIQNTDISTLLTDALLAMGCDKALIANLDAHSDLVLDFHDMPSIHVLSENNDVRIWASLGERHGYRQLIESHSAQMLLELAQPQDYAYGGSLALPIQDETLQLSAIVRPDYLTDSEKFGEALEAFFARVVTFNQIVGA
jgi:hypothetical protein